MDALRLYFRCIAISIRSQMQYRASFIMMTIGMFVLTATEILGICVLFDRFKTLRGWRLEEVALFYGMISIAFAISESVGRGFDTFDRMIKRGDFDRLLLRPRGTAFQIAAQEWQLMRIGRLAQSLIVLLWATSALDVTWTTARICLLLFAISGGACLFYGLFILQATLAFWTVEALEIVNTVTYGGNETAQYPLSIYRPWFRKFFTFVVPLACVTYFPALAILDRDDAVLASPVWFRWTAPLIGILFLAVSLRLWRFGVRRYRSTGS
jgi:ABC-2 type transport system permease protein